MTKINDTGFYNEASSHKLGWEPKWFGCEEFDDELESKIKDFQREHKLVPDGLCGPNTYRIIYTEILEKKKRADELIFKKLNNEKTIICNNQFVPIDWEKVVNPLNQNALQLKEGYKEYNNKRKPRLFIIHWDATLSSNDCYNILNKRDLSVHFSIDNDGTVYQFLDTNHIAYHAKPLNNESIGVEITNAVYEKYQNYYKKKFGKERPILKNIKCHEKKYGNILGFYEEQISALKQLIKSCCDYYQIKLQCPLDSEGDLINGVYEPVFKDYSGIICHYHLNKGKWDTSGLQLKEIIEDIKCM